MFSADRKSIIGLRIKTMRLSRRMTQADLAKALNQSQSSITMYETGRCEPHFQTLEALADIFNVSLASIVSDDELDSVAGGSMSKEDQRFVASYTALPPPGKDYLQQQLRVAQVMFREKPTK